MIQKSLAPDLASVVPDVALVGLCVVHVVANVLAVTFDLTPVLPGLGLVTTPDVGFEIAPVVPEPSSIALGLLGLGAIALFRRRK